MPNQFRENRIANRYRRRSASVGPETHRLRGDTSKILVKELRMATNNDLYDRTPLPVSHKMFQSIGAKFSGNTVEAGYGFYGKGDYAKYRINMTGRSMKGGHILDMHPAEYLRKHANPQIRKAARAAQRKILNPSGT